MYCYANIGVPRNIENPYYQQTDKESNPHGYNSLGTKYVDYGLGANPNPAPDGSRFYKRVPGDIPEFRGLFKTPSMRGADKRPSPDFVKAYMHNGVFESPQLRKSTGRVSLPRRSGPCLGPRAAETAACCRTEGPCG